MLLLHGAEMIKSQDELAALLKENGIELDNETTSRYFSYLEKKNGEMEDDELDLVSGGGCQTDVGGDKKTVVTSACRCFTGEYALNFSPDLFKDVDLGRIGTVAVPLPNMTYYPLYTTDNKELRMIWSTICGYGDCGSCARLAFKCGLGYCSVS